MDLKELTKSIENGECVVYEGDLVGWCTCKIKSRQKIAEHTRVLVQTSDGTILTRFLKEAKTIDDLSPNGCVYFISK